MASLVSREGRQFQRYIQGLRQVVGCIPYRYKKNPNQFPPIGGTLIEEIEVLLISSQKCQRMMFPKGGWEIDESIKEAALRETREEAGVVGIVQGKLGKWCFKSKSQAKFHEGHMFPMLVKEQLNDFWPERNRRHRRWMTIREARETCEALWMKEALDVFVLRLLEDKENQKPYLFGFQENKDMGDRHEEKAVEKEEDADQCEGENIKSTCSTFSSCQFPSERLRSCLERPMLMVQE